MQSKEVKFPFFIIVDDGGFMEAIPDRASQVGLGVYETILDLAREYDLCLPICVTTQWLDPEGRGRKLPYAAELIALFRENAERLCIAYHGHTHEYCGHAGEFYCLDTNEAVPEQEQQDHIEASRRIFDFWSMPFPALCVPPYNAWEEGTTDRLLASAGVKTLVGYKTLRYKGLRYHWKGSKYLQFFPRTSIGLAGCDLAPDPFKVRKIRLYPRKTLLEFVKDHVRPQRLAARLRISHSLRNEPVHSYMTHIGNFFPDSMDFWRRLFDAVQENNQILFCKTYEDAAVLYERCSVKG